MSKENYWNELESEVNLEVKDMNTDCKQCLRPEAKKGMLRMPALNIDQNTISPLIQLAFMTAYKTSGELWYLIILFEYLNERITNLWLTSSVLLSRYVGYVSWKENEGKNACHFLVLFKTSLSRFAPPSRKPINSKSENRLINPWQSIIPNRT